MKDSVVQVGIVGTGRISDLHAIEYLHNPAGRIVALCDKDPSLATQRATAWGLTDIAIEDSLDALLARADVDMVEILLPHHLHLEAALKAIAAGKIVSLQKPMCLTLEQADQLVAAAASSSKPFKVFENFIFYPPVAKAKALIDDGVIGTPQAIRIKTNTGTSKTAWQIPAGATAWRQNREKSGGGPLVFDDGHHKFALAWYFMGNPEQVHAFIGRTEAEKDVWFDAPAMITFTFPEGRAGCFDIVHSPGLEIMGQYYPQDDRVEITGTHGVLWINCGHGRLGSPSPVVYYRDGITTLVEDLDVGWEQSFVLSTRHFLDVLVNGGQPVLTAPEAREVLRFGLAAEQSAREGKVITFTDIR